MVVLCCMEIGSNTYQMLEERLCKSVDFCQIKTGKEDQRRRRKESNDIAINIQILVKQENTLNVQILLSLGITNAAKSDIVFTLQFLVLLVGAS
jgi:hypothetical protein